MTDLDEVATPILEDEPVADISPAPSLSSDNVPLSSDEVLPVIDNPTITNPAPEDLPPIDALATPLSEPNAISGLKTDGDFLPWAIDQSLAFLELGDLEPIVTVGSLRGLKEVQIRDKIQIANSILVLAANYGSEKNNQELVDTCTAYALKMQIIIKRLCL